ncbi:MAG: BtpA/SgcQ family protein [Candidatus Micrarchaeaceae archaeon]
MHVGNSLRDIFGISKPIIGAVHFAPLLGYKDSPGIESILENAEKDLRALEEGGVDGVIFENNYDLPHKINVGPETVVSMSYLCAELGKDLSIPFGISVLWNDYKAALAIAKVVGGKFVRVPVFVDSVETDFGVINADPVEVIKYRSNIEAEGVSLFTDIQVKHATMLKERPIAESAIEAEKQGADVLIVTGRWTGNAPDISKLREAKESSKLEIIVGSGLDASNVERIFQYADGAIVSTSLKEGRAIASERNVKPMSARINTQKVFELMRIVKKIREY